MAPNWSDPKVKTEKVKIDPYELIAQAEKYAESEDYNSAEKTYITAIKNAIGTASQADIVSKVKSGLTEVYDSWAAYCYQNYKFEDAELVLNKALKINLNIRNIKRDLRTLYETWGDSLSYEGKLEGAENRYIHALQMDKELGNDYKSSILLIGKIKKVMYMYNSNSEKRLAYLLYILEEGKAFGVKAMILGVIGVICIISAIAFHGDDDVFWMVLAIMFISPIVVPMYSFNYERQQTRGKFFASLLYMFFWTIIGVLCCAIDPLYAFYPAVVGVACVYHAIKMKGMSDKKNLYSRVIELLVSKMKSEGQVDITVSHNVEDEKKDAFKNSVNRAVALGVRTIVKNLFR